MKFSQLLHRQAGVRIGPVGFYPDRGRHLAVQTTDQRVPGSGAAFGGGARRLPGRQSQGHLRNCRRAARAGNRRRRGHALHVFAGDDGRLAGADRHLPHRHGHRPRAGAGAEPRGAGAAAPAGGSARHRRLHAQELAGVPHGGAPDLARRTLRLPVSAQLRHAERARHARAPERRRRRARVRRRRLRHARVARSAEDVRARPHHRRCGRAPSANRTCRWPPARSARRRPKAPSSSSR